MKTAIYISGLGQSFQEESVEKYAYRFLHEFSYAETGVKYSTLTEKYSYAVGQETTVVSILKETGETKEPIYRFYDFTYNHLLTQKFNERNILVKNIILFWLVIKKLPRLIYRIFSPGAYSHTRQTLYVFGLFLIIATAILFILPVALGVILDFLGTDAYKTFVASIKENIPFIKSWGINRKLLSNMADYFLSVTAVLLIVLPQTKVVVTTLASEFVCANNYLDSGYQSQNILGNLEQLVEFIAEREPGCKIHFHTYSFGSIVALDLLFPVKGTLPSKNVQLLSELIITIGTPVEFVKAYYPEYYAKRENILDGTIKWINIYSVKDALASNFRKDNKEGDATEGLSQNTLLPQNFSYEISTVRKNIFFESILLNGVKEHSVYWDSASVGLSCVRIIFNQLKQQQLF